MARATRDAATRRRPVRTRRRWGAQLYLTGAVVFLVLLWLVYWYGASQIAAAVRYRVAAAADARGYAVECVDEVGGGFPLSVDLVCSRATLAGKADALTAVLDGFAATTPLYRPGRIEWQATGPLVLDAPADYLGLTATWTRAETSLDIGLGGLSGVASVLKDVRIDLAPDRRTGPYQGLAVASADLSISPGADDAYLVSASARAVVLESDDGRDLPAIDLDADVSALAFGDSLGLDPRGALRDWRARGGALRVDELSLAVGNVSTRSSGNLFLSPEGKLSGELRLEIAGIETLPDLVETFRPGSRETVDQITAAVVAFTRPVETPDGTTREMTLLIRDNVVSIGIIPIGVLPTIPF